MPSNGPLIDRFGRIHTDLRISITDRCNLRCIYCMPEEGVPTLPRQDVLKLEEIAEIASISFDLGVRSVRITGGEPLVRKGVETLISMLSAVGFEDLSMTTNGMYLESMAEKLKDAGLKRVNISIDSLDEQKFASIRRRGDLTKVLNAIRVAKRVGLSPIKVNVVLMKGQNENEILDFARYGRENGVIVRFIEFMPLDASGQWSQDKIVPADSVVETINEYWPIGPASLEGLANSAPAKSYRYLDGGGEIGVVASMTAPFCGDCNRLRLTSDGAFRNCLFSIEETHVRQLLSAPDSRKKVEQAIRECVWGKKMGHGTDEPGFVRPNRTISMVGG
ncbi:MAG: GTP 3',8-cyclase MoaA [Acidimicrobiales bacterium]|nr:GTP 3',8-cyclase MoaA [Acidimicrobiales bacterium]